MSASPTAAVALARMNGAIDVRGILQNVRAPTLVICRKDDARVDPQASRYLADHIPGARLVEIPGRDHPVWTGDVDRVADIVEEFLTGVRPQPASRRMLSALLVARIIAPERLAARLGDREWRELAAQFRNTAEAIAAAAGGQACGFDGERILLRIDGAAKAARSAVTLRDAAKAMGLSVAQAIHAGEVEFDGETVSGLAVHIAGRIADAAETGDILVSSVAADLSAGSGLHFVERAALAFDGLNGPLRLSMVATRAASRTDHAPAQGAEPCRAQRPRKASAEAGRRRAQQPGHRGRSQAERAHGEAPCRQHPAEARPADPRGGGSSCRSPTAALISRRLARSGHRTDGAFGRSGRDAVRLSIDPMHGRGDGRRPVPRWRSTCRDQSVNSACLRRRQYSPQ